MPQHSTLSPIRFVNPLRGLAALSERFYELPPTIKRPILFLGAVLIIVIPALLYNMAAQSASDAAQWVSHTNAVKDKVHETLYHLRDGEAAARTQLLSPRLQSGNDFENAMSRLDGNLVDLRNMTLDNPRQQERIGQLRVSLEGRNKALHDALDLYRAGHADAAIAKIALSIESFPFREPSQAMIDEEQNLLDSRIRKASRKRTLAGGILIASVVAQFLLLGSVYFVSEKDARRRQQAEEESRASAVQARSIVEGNPDPLVVMDHNARLQDCNKAFLALYHVEADAVKGRYLRDLGDGAWNIAELHQRLLDIVPRQREIWDMEITQLLDGESRSILVNARAFPGLGGSKMILLSAKDVTSRKRTEEQILGLNKELGARIEQAQMVNQELEAFSYSVSHDLRAPLRHITGFADMLQSHLKAAPTAPDAKTLRYLGFILESANQMGTLIDDLLVFSRMGRSEMVNEEVDMEALVREVVRHFHLETEGRRVEFVVSPLPSVRGDGSMLRLVWMNLIGNAVKYSRARDEARIEIGTRPGEGRDTADTVYFVRDNGVGFNMKYLHKLFGVFQRLHQASEYEGTGIGLANVRRIVQRHGGKVWAQGYVDQGATFSFSLPPVPLLTPSQNLDAAQQPKGYLSQLSVASSTSSTPPQS